MKALSLQQVMGKIQRLPTPPAVVLDLMRKFNNENVSTEELARKIGEDQALTASVLRVANSSSYGMSGRVSSLPQAALLLGTQVLRTLTIAAGIANQFPVAGNAADFDWRNYSHHAIVTAQCAQSLAGDCGQEADTAYVAGLIHDIGKLVLATQFPAEYRQVIEHGKRHRVNVLTAERLLLGIDHPRVGAVLAQRWNLPATLQAVIANHHDPETGLMSPLTDLVFAADTHSHDPDCDVEQTAQDATVPPPALARLGVDATVVEACAAKAAIAAEEIVALLFAQFT